MRIKEILSKFKLKSFPNYQIAYMVVLVMVFHLFNLSYDNDFWFTINQGRYVLEHGFPIKAINTIHDIDFIYQSWGSGVIFYSIYNYIGLYGIVFLLLSVGSLTMYFFYKLCMRISDNKRASLIITLIAFMLYVSKFLVTRPHIFTVLNLTICLYLLESYIKTNKAKYLYWLPLIFLFQINIHGIYFILLLIILIPYLINSFKFKFLNIKSLGYRKKPLFIAYICSLLVGFINPYGYKTIIYGFSSYQASGLYNNSINELIALDFHQLFHKVFIVTIIVVLILHFCNIKKMPIRYTLLLLGTSYLAFDAFKSFYLFVICGLFSLSLLIKKRKDDPDKDYSKRYHITHCSITLLIIVAGLFLKRDSTPPATIKFIDYLDANVENKEKIKLYTDDVDGSYAQFRGFYTYFDPRSEIYLKVNNKKEDIFEEYINLEKGLLDYKEFIDKYQFDYILVELRGSFSYHMQKDSYKYKVVMEDGIRTLYKLED